MAKLHSTYDNLLEGPVPEACIYRRNGGCAVLVDTKVYIWGGESSELLALPSVPEGEDDEDDEDDDMEDVWRVTVLPPRRLIDEGAPFDVYDLQTCSWSRKKTGGDAPLFGLGMIRFSDML